MYIELISNIITLHEWSHKKTKTYDLRETSQPRPLWPVNISDLDESIS